MSDEKATRRTVHSVAGRARQWDGEGPRALLQVERSERVCDGYWRGALLASKARVLAFEVAIRKTSSRVASVIRFSMKDPIARK
jgi:hypothetical protein